MIEITRTFLKYRYHTHVLKDDDSWVTHGLKYGLGRSQVNSDLDKTFSCKTCMYPFYLCESLAEELSCLHVSYDLSEETISDAVNVVKDTSKKISFSWLTRHDVHVGICQ